MTAMMNTDAVKLATCSRCKATPGQDCKTKKGRRLFAPHAQRLWDLQHMPGFTLAKYQVRYPEGTAIGGGNTRTPKRGSSYS